MLSNIEMEPRYQVLFENALRKMSKPELIPNTFISLLENNRGMINLQKRKNELEPKNPLIVALGDSVTAGHFEAIMDEQGMYFVQNLQQAYIEQFKQMLQEACGISTFNIINSGIAGDNIKGMQMRLERDVLRYDPNLVIINGALNWNKKKGTTEDYKRCLTEVIQQIREHSKAELILVTPNMAVVTPKDDCLQERVDVIRTLAHEQKLILADVYAIWEDVCTQDPSLHLEDLLANRENHPTPYGHYVYAKVLMQLFSSVKKAEPIPIEYEKARI